MSYVINKIDIALKSQDEKVKSQKSEVEYKYIK